MGTHQWLRGLNPYRLTLTHWMMALMWRPCWITCRCIFETGASPSMSNVYLAQAQASAFSAKSHSCLGSVNGFRSACSSLSHKMAQLLALASFKRVGDLHGLCSRTYSSIKLLLYSLSSPVWVRGTVTVTYGCIISVRSGLWRLICKSMTQVW